MRPRSTPSSHSSPSAPSVGPRAASSARWSAPLAAAASQTNTSLRSLVVLPQTGLRAAASQRRPRQDGLQRHRTSGSAKAGHDLEWATYTPGNRDFRQFAMTPLAPAPESSPQG